MRTIQARSNIISSSCKILADDKKRVKVLRDSVIGNYVSEADVIAHLTLLHCFSQLQKEVRQGYAYEHLPAYSATDNGTLKNDPITHAEPDHAWMIFLNKALHRFELYVTNVLRTLPQLAQYNPHFQDLSLERATSKDVICMQLPSTHLPPLDVALIWHAYCLNPSRLYEDAHRVQKYAPLAQVAFPLESLVKFMDSNSPRVLCPEAEATWQSCIVLPFDPMQPGLQNAPISCPFCRAQNEVAWGQVTSKHWKAKCQHCMAAFGPEEIAGRLWLDDASVWCAGGDDITGFRLRGAVLSAHDDCYFPKDPYAPILLRIFANNRTSTSLSAEINAQFDPSKDLYGTITRGQETPQSLAQKLGLNIDNLSSQIWQHVKETGIYLKENKTVIGLSRREEIDHRINLMFKFYKDAHSLSQTSLDLCAAVNRQYKFVDEMEKLGWLERPGLVSYPQLWDRYTKWLGLASLKPGPMVPTLDIDLVWHTHMLSASYYWDLYHAIGLFLDHNDKVEGKDLTRFTHYSEGSWKQLYKESYMESSNKASSFKSLFGKSKSSEQSEPSIGAKKLSLMNKVQVCDQASFDKLSDYAQSFYVTGASETSAGNCMSGGDTRVGYSSCLSVDLGYKTMEQGILSQSVLRSRSRAKYQDSSVSAIAGVSMGF